jgi:hypothetical protein
MSDAPLSIPERAALLALMTFVEEVSNADIRARYGFSIDGKVRTRLERDGYLRGERARDRPGRPFVLQLEDKGWRWCRDELGAPPPNRALKPYRLLYGALNTIDLHLRRSQCTMADFFAVGEAPRAGTAATAAPAGQPTGTSTIEKRLRSAYDDLVAEPGGWVGLRRLRERLADLPRADVDAALLQLDQQRGVYLEPEINQKTLSEADWAAAIRIGGEPKHLLSIEGT